MRLAQQFRRLAQLGGAVGRGPVDVGRAVDDVRSLLDASGVGFRIVGGLAVAHHGYARFTEDVDILVENGGNRRLEPHLRRHGFSREETDRLRHDASGVRVDLLEAGQAIPRAGGAIFPDPNRTAGSATDPTVIALPELIELKLHGGRKQDEADVVALLKQLDDAAYVKIEAQVAPTLRPMLLQLREDALEELRWSGDK